MTNSDPGERLERLAEAEKRKSGWTIVLISIAGLVAAVLALTFAYGQVRSDDNRQFAHFEHQLQDSKRKIDDGAAERDRLKGEIANGAAERDRLGREIEALKGVLANNNVPIPPDIAGAGPTTTQPRSTTTTTSRTATSVTTAPTTTTTQPRPSTTTTTSMPPMCTVPTLPGGRCIVP